MNSIHLQQTLPQVFADRNSVTSDVWHQDLIFRKEEMYLIEAASGTGKSSLCSYIYGYRNDYQGIINFDEINIKAYSVKQWVDLRKHSLKVDAATDPRFLQVLGTCVQYQMGRTDLLAGFSLDD